MFFGKIRAMNGYSDNPTAVQFMSAYRKLLHKCDLHVSPYANIKELVSSNILTVPSFLKRRTTLKNDVNECSEKLETAFDEWEESFEGSHLHEIGYLIEATEDSGIVYVANMIERKLTTSDQIYCEDCIDVFKTNEKVSNKACVNIQDGKPCSSTYILCKLTDDALKLHINTGVQMKTKIYLDVMSNISWHSIFPIFNAPNHDSDHKRFLIKFIIDEYTSINKKCAYLAKQKTLDLQKRYLRNRLRKLCHHLHQ